MTYQVIVQPSAQAELEAAYEWAAERAPMTAARWSNPFIDAIRSLANNPERCPLAPENEYFLEEIRNLFYGKRTNAYRIIFTIRGDTVHVLHIRRGSREVLKPETGEPTE
jgi:plasmid stabilization system protein ParE